MPLQKSPIAPDKQREIQRLPGSSQEKQIVRKKFNYEIDAEVGKQFKLWCIANDITAQLKLEQLLREFLDERS
jgi:hypothetical protein